MPHRSIRRSSFLLIALAGATAPLAGAAPFEALPQREPIAKPAQIERPTQFETRLVVKFRDDLGVRASAGELRSIQPLEGVRAIDVAAPIAYRQLLRVDDARLDAIENRSAARTGVRPIDLRSMVTVDAPQDELEAVARQLLALDEVEWVSFEPVDPIEPPCVDAAPVSGFLANLQAYTGADPGINMDAAWALGDARGAGVQFADIEYNARFNHEDLCGVTPEAGVTFPAFSFDSAFIDHGTAVLGILNAVDNAYGMTGLVPDASGFFFPEWTNEQGQRRATAITNAAAALDVGDFLVLEMQTFGPTGVSGEWAPAEYDLSVWTATRAATDAGLIVFAAAGNGAQNLDGPLYNEYNGRGDSGAVMIGAGTPDTNHARLSFSNFGARLDVQAWGSAVDTTGYGGLATYGGDPDQSYTSSFGGTSSATPIATSAGISIQSYAMAEYGQTLDAATVRQILIDTGIPQGSGGAIGPLPNVVAARAEVDAMFDTCFADITTDGACAFGSSDGAVTLSDFSCYLSEWSAGSANADVTLSGVCDPGNGGDGVDLSDFSCYLSEWSAGCP